MRYYFVAFTAKNDAWSSAFGNSLISHECGLSLAQIAEMIKKKSSFTDVAILNIQFLTEEQYKELKGNGED